MSQAKLTHTLGDNINQSLLIRDNLCCFLKKLSRHMAQGTNGADRLGRELKDTRHAACKRGGNKLRCEHGKMSVDFPNEAARCQRFSSGRAQSSFAPRDENGLAATRPPCYLMQNARSRDRVRKGHQIIAGCSEAWYRAWFGTRRSWVQIPPARYPFSVGRSPRRQTVGSNRTNPDSMRP